MRMKAMILKYSEHGDSVPSLSDSLISILPFVSFMCKLGTRLYLTVICSPSIDMNGTALHYSCTIVILLLRYRASPLVGAAL